jgi:hypothetical protein
MVRRQNLGVIHTVIHPDFHRLDKAVKRFILTLQYPISAAGSLPGKAKRDSLEELAWEAV